MRVCIHHKSDACVLSLLAVVVAKIQPVRLRVDFQAHAMLSASREYLFPIHVDGIAAADDATTRVTYAVDHTAR